MLNRRHFTLSAAALFSAPIPSLLSAAPTSKKSNWDEWDAQITPEAFDPATSNPWGLHRRFLPRRVQANPGLTPGDIHVDAVARYLYHVEEGGSYKIRRKAKWPTWTPTAAMIKREPETYEQHAAGMDAGPSNPLGSRALYLYAGSRDTYLRIHGSPNPRSIGGRASSGCVRMVMAHINELYENVSTGVTAHLHPAETYISEEEVA